MTALESYFGMKNEQHVCFVAIVVKEQERFNYPDRMDFSVSISDVSGQTHPDTGGMLFLFLISPSSFVVWFGVGGCVPTCVRICVLGISLALSF